jgi:hypothetical protein
VIGKKSQNPGMFSIQIHGEASHEKALSMASNNNEYRSVRQKMKKHIKAGDLQRTRP